MANPPDACAVKTAELAPCIRAYIDKWERGKGRRTYTGVSALHQRTQSRSVDPTGRGVPESTIRSILAERRRLTELRIADALLTATEQPFALLDGTCEVVPNPRGKPDQRARCCGSSLDLMTLFGAMRPDGTITR